jgi:superfamily II DNA or RNA helicase
MAYDDITIGSWVELGAKSFLLLKEDRFLGPKFCAFNEDMRLKGPDNEEILLYEHDPCCLRFRIPRGMWLETFGDNLSFSDERTEGANRYSFQSSFVPLEGQQSAVDSVLAQLRNGLSSGGILVARCGQGKTVLAVELALRLGVPTCVLVHKEFLMRQWEEAIGMLSSASVGRCQRDRCDSGADHPFVVATIQSLVSSKREYPESFYRSFGLLICDEVHRYGSELWKTAIGLFPAKYRLGLTARAERLDGYWPLIEAHMGPILYDMPPIGLVPQVYMIKTDTDIPEYIYDRPWLSAEARRGKLITSLSNHDGRNAIVVQSILRAFSGGRKTLVLSERRKHLDDLCRMALSSSAYQLAGIPVGEEGPLKVDDVGFYVGGTTQEKLDIAAKKDVIFGTYQMAKEGLNIVDLDTLIMATPQYSIQQSVGRILRPYDKARPFVIDFVDKNIDPLRGQAYGRRKQYVELQYEIIEL